MKGIVCFINTDSHELKKKLTSFIVVPHLPPQSFGYLHPGVEAWIKSPGSICKFISSK